MPELPEVETIKRELLQKIKGKKIRRVEVRLPQMLNVSAEKFKKTLVGATVEDIIRRAKLLIISLSGGWSLVIHLKLTGQLIYKAGEEKTELWERPSSEKSWSSGLGKHTHIIYTFADSSQLFHNDLRRFGYTKLVATQEIPHLLEEGAFGPEPLERDFSLGLFKKLLAKKPRAKIKPLLMDQTFLAGIGNVYSDEICFYAQVHPRRFIQTLKEDEIKKLYQGTGKILREAIEHKGSSVDSYVDIFGQKGKFLPFLKVYGREGQSCLKCRSKIKAMKLGGRTAHFCPSCQR